MKKELCLVLHNIRSAYNVGAIFRSADGAGVTKIYLTGYTQVPSLAQRETEKSSAEKMIEKTALGAEKTVPWEKYDDIQILLTKLKKEEMTIVALEKTEAATEIEDYVPVFPMALVLGHEVDGVSVDIMEKCDDVVEIPMRGQKESLNVSVAAGIAMYQLLL